MSLIPFLFWADWVVGVVLKIMAILLMCATFEGNIHEIRFRKYIVCTENFETHGQGKTGNKQGNSSTATFGSIMLSITQKMMKVSHQFRLSFVGVVKTYLHLLPSAKTNKCLTLQRLKQY